MDEEKKITGIRNIMLNILSVLLLCLLLFPLFWIVVTSLKTEKEIFQIPPTLFPRVLNTKSYVAQVATGVLYTCVFLNKINIGVSNTETGSI